MTFRSRYGKSATLLTGLLPLVLLGACASASGGGMRPPNEPRFQMGDNAAVARARADSLRYPYTKADIDFMSGMIHHHAQAIYISRWAVSHGADPAVQRLTARIINAQQDEITLMQTWLKDRLQPVPMVDTAGRVTVAGGGHDAHGAHAGHDMSAMGGAMMPGMLSDAQLKELDAARGADYDRLFLTYMIMHHRGAVTMVTQLFTSDGAGQDETVFKFANDVEVDQSTEIKRMFTMMLERGWVPPQ
ncbi:MAG: DUF305 domain-containing protein [Gemmatimonadaceae bacterium]|nr:DUF305 domain-containing protein [Gemmatimonadaceae bacterium]